MVADGHHADTLQGWSVGRALGCVIPTSRHSLTAVVCSRNLSQAFLRDSGTLRTALDNCTCNKLMICLVARYSCSLVLGAKRSKLIWLLGFLERQSIVQKLTKHFLGKRKVGA